MVSIIITRGKLLQADYMFVLCNNRAWFIELVWLKSRYKKVKKNVCFCQTLEIKEKEQNTTQKS